MNIRILLSALMLTLGASAVEADQTLRIGIEAAYPPFAYKLPSGDIAGFDYDIGNALCQEMQVQCTWIEQEFDGLIPALKVRKFDAVLSSLSITDDRKKSVDFTQRYYQSPARLVMKAGSVIGDDLSGIAGKSIGVQRSSIHDRFASAVLETKGATIVRYSSQNEVYLDVSNGRLDGTLADQLILDQGFIKQPIGRGFAFVGPTLADPRYFGEGVGIAVRKGDKRLAERFNKAIRALRESGQYQAINAKYFDFDVYGE